MAGFIKPHTHRPNRRQEQEMRRPHHEEVEAEQAGSEFWTDPYYDYSQDRVTEIETKLELRKTLIRALNKAWAQ